MLGEAQMLCSVVGTDLTHRAVGFNVGLSSLPDSCLLWTVHPLGVVPAMSGVSGGH